MSVSTGRHRAIALIVCVMMGAPALAAQKASNAPLLPGSSSKEPISIDADKLEYFDKEQKAIYTGNVVAIQGDSKLTCSVMTLFLAKTAPQPAAAAAASSKPPGSPPAASGDSSKPPSSPPAAGGDSSAAGGSQVKHMDATGPVTVVSKTQVATGDRGAYDKDQNKVWLFGNVTLSDSGGNVTKGDKLTYDLTAGTAVVEVDQGGADKTHKRVQSQFIPGSNNPAAADADNAAKKPSDPKPTAKTAAKPKKTTDQ